MYVQDAQLKQKWEMVERKETFEATVSLLAKA